MRVRAQLWAALLASVILLVCAQSARAAVTTPPATYYLTGHEGEAGYVNIRPPSWTLQAYYAAGEEFGPTAGSWGAYAVCLAEDWPDVGSAGDCQVTSFDYTGDAFGPYPGTLPVAVEVWRIATQACPYATSVCILSEPDYVPPSADAPASAASGALATEATVSEAVSWLGALFWLGVTGLGFFGYSVGARDA